MSVMELNKSKKRVRSQNFTPNEKCTFVKLVSQNPIVITKVGEGVTLNDREESWNIVYNEFNKTTDSKRSLQSLKKLWDNLRREVRQRKSQNRSFDDPLLNIVYGLIKDPSWANNTNNSDNFDILSSKCNGADDTNPTIVFVDTFEVSADENVTRAETSNHRRQTDVRMNSSAEGNGIQPKSERNSLDSLLENHNIDASSSPMDIEEFNRSIAAENLAQLQEENRMKLEYLNEKYQLELDILRIKRDVQKKILENINQGKEQCRCNCNPQSISSTL